MTMKTLSVELFDERLITPSGLSLVGQMLGKSNFIKQCNNNWASPEASLRRKHCVSAWMISVRHSERKSLMQM